MTKEIPFIIVQASGRGKRMKHLTFNKSKALISLFGQPLLLQLINLYQKSYFIILGHYQFSVLDLYLKKFVSSQRYRLIKTIGDNLGSSVGINQALSLIPDKTPLMIVWCDLFHEKKIDFSQFDLNKNYLGLSGSFPCRWSFKNGDLRENRSLKYGVAGLFIFSNKKVLDGLPEKGEFCQFLKKKKIAFDSFFLDGVFEVGTVKKYYQLIKKYPVVRPFNRLIIKEKTVMKIPIKENARFLAEKESLWYEKMSQKKFRFLPKVYQLKPLKLEKIKGKPLYLYSLSIEEKKVVLKKIVNHLEVIHRSFPPKKGDYYQNNLEAYLEKTQRRLKEVSSFIPYFSYPYLIINQKRCFNFTQNWPVLTKYLKPHLTNIYYPIHGDCTFSNILYQKKTKKIFFIDPRGYFGKEDFFGDIDYDWAKIYYSLIGNYDQFNQKRFYLKISQENIILKIKSNGYSFLEKDFFQLTRAHPQKIRLLHGVIWLSLSSYVFDDVDSMAGAFYQGIYLLNQVINLN